MSYHLPSLNGLRAFEAAARHLSFKHAAGELFVTPGAVSQQVKGLEEELGIVLFRRLTRAIELTEAGHALFGVVRDSFQRMSDTVEGLVERDRTRPLTISVLPSVAAKWLVPRLGRFRERHPEVEVRIAATERLVDFAREDVDAAIRHTIGPFLGLRADPMFPGDYFPVCSPRLLEGLHPLLAPADLRFHVLLHSEPAREWPAWIEAYGVEGVNPHRGPQFSDDGLMLEAAIEGQGVAISRAPLVAADLAAGHLVRPFDLALADRFSYFLVSPEHTADVPKIAAFREWVLAEAAQEQKVSFP